jgi:hypothetical protein
MAVVAAVAAVLLIAFLLWFTFGTRRNISRGNELLRWLQAGLPVLGRRTTVRWLGSSAVQLAIDRAEPPYASAQVNVVLEPRDVGLLWALARRRGRRDFLILRGTLCGPPRFELEASAREGGTSTDRLDRLDPGAWLRTTWSVRASDDDGDNSDADGDGDATPTVDVAHSARADGADLDAAHETWDRLAAAAGGRVWRLSVRNLAPNVEVRLEPPASDALGTTDATALTEAFAALGRLASRDAPRGGEPDADPGPGR